MAKNFYIVTRMVRGERVGQSYPNLGGHTNLEKAIKHFEGIKEHREQTYKNYKCYWDRSTAIHAGGGTRESVRECYMQYDECGAKVTEELIIEKYSFTK